MSEMEIDLDSTLVESAEDKREPICIVRLSRSYWHHEEGMYCKVSLRYLKRKCQGYNLLKEDAYISSAIDVMPKIVNLDKCDDGIYQVVSCNVSTDWETGYVDDYDYQLIPWKD